MKTLQELLALFNSAKSSLADLMQEFVNGEDGISAPLDPRTSERIELAYLVRKNLEYLFAQENPDLQLIFTRLNLMISYIGDVTAAEQVYNSYTRGSGVLFLPGVNNLQFASNTIYGISRLSVAPLVANQPIAVGDNDPRIVKGVDAWNDSITGVSVDADGNIVLATRSGASVTSTEKVILNQFASAQDANIWIDGNFTAEGEIKFSGLTDPSSQPNVVVADGNGRLFKRTLAEFAGDINLGTFTANRAIVSNGSGALSVSATTATQIGYLSTLTSDVQTQLDNKQPLDADLTAIAALSGNGLLRKTAGVWGMDTNTYLTANQTITLSGDVTGSGSTAISTIIANDAVTFAKMQNINTARILGRSTSGAGNVEEISIGTGLSLSAGVLSNSMTQYTDADARAAISENIVGIDYNSATGEFSMTSGYSLPTDAIQATWTAAYNNSITSVGFNTLTGDLTFTQQDAGTIVVDLDGRYLTANQAITISGDATGTGTTAITLTLASTGVAAGTYRSVTVDAKGRVTAGTNPTTVSGYGITDFYAQVISGFVVGANTSVTNTDTLEQAIEKLQGQVDARLTANQTITLSGDLSGSGSTSIAATIANDAVTFAKMQNVSSGIILGRSTAASGDIEELTVGTGLSLSAGVLRVAALTANRVVISGASGELSVSSTTATQVGYLSDVTSAIQAQINGKQNADATLTALAAIGSNTIGFVVLNGVDSFTTRVLDGSPNRITINNANGSGTNPTIDIASTYAGQSSITTLGTITSGVWNGSSIADSYILSAANWNEAYDEHINSITFNSANGNLTANQEDGGNITVSLDGRYVRIAGETMTGYLTLAGNPINANHAANKAYVDAIGTGVLPRGGANAATTTTLPTYIPTSTTLTGSVNGALPAIDGVTLVNGNTILVKNEVSNQYNGFYTVTNVGSAGAPYVLTRTSNMDTWDELPRSTIFIQSGSTQAGYTYYCTVSTGGTLGTTPVTFEIFSIGSVYTAGAGIDITGNTISIDSGSIVNSMISASAAIGLTKLAATTASRALVSDASGYIVAANTTAIEIGYLNGVTSAIQTQLNNKQPLDATLSAFSAIGGGRTGIIVLNGVDSFTTRTITGVTNRTAVTNGDGVSGNPTIDIAATYAGQSSITTLGTIATGVWQGTAVADAYIASSTNWNTAFNNMIVSAAFDTATGVITLTQQDAGTVTVDIDGRYLTGNQTITLSGDVSGSGTTAITTTIGAGKVTNLMLVNSTISGIALGSNLNDLTAGTGLQFNTGTTYNGGTAKTLSIDSSVVTLTGVQTLTNKSIVATQLTGTLQAAQFPALLGEATTTAGSLTVTLTNSAVIGKVLTGYVSGAGTITATDTILSAIQKLNGNIGALVTGVSSVSGTSNRITASPTSGAVVVDIASTYVGQTSITTLGTIGTGVWQGTAIADAYISSASTWNAKIGGSGTTGYIPKFTASGAVGDSVIRESNGNIGIATNPAAWDSNYTALQVGNSLGFLGDLFAADIYANSYFDGTNFRYIGSNFASLYALSSGKHQFLTAPTGTAGDIATFTKRFEIGNDGTIEVSTTPSTSAGTFDLITRNTSTGVLEKVASSYYATAGSISGTTGRLAKFTSSSAVGDSIVSESVALITIEGQLLVQEDKSADSARIYIRNSSTAATTTKTSELLFSLRDTVGTFKDSVKIKSVPTGVNIIDAYLSIGVRGSDALGEQIKLSATELITFGATDTGEAHIFGGSARVNGALGVTDIITFAGNTRYGVSKVYNTITGDMFGMEQASEAQTGSGGAATRIFTSALNPLNYISLGKYTDATTFVDHLKIMSGTGAATFSSTITTGSAATLGSSANNGVTNNWSVFRGVGVSDGSADYGSYGGFILNANNEYSASARQFLITNAYHTSSFAIIRSTNATTPPSLGVSGVVSSGVVDFSISNSGAATFSSSVTAAEMNVTGTTSLFYLTNTTPTTGNQWRLSSAANGKLFVTNVTGGIDALEFAASGAATFSSSVTSTDFRTSGAGYITFDADNAGTGTLVIRGGISGAALSFAANNAVTLSNIPNATTDTDRFLVSDSGTIKYRTGAELLSDIGAAPSTGSANYIQNQFASAQTASMWITGDIKTNGRVYIGANGAYIEEVLVGSTYELRVVDSAGNTTVIS